MAASGAAVSSNMGAETIKPLTATLALLNVRLGYWLRNPAKVRGGEDGARATRCQVRSPQPLGQLLFHRRGPRAAKRKAEVGLFDRRWSHRESRHLRTAQAALPRLSLPSMPKPIRKWRSDRSISLERYALIDMGVRIDLPWQQITDESLVTC